MPSSSVNGEMPRSKNFGKVAELNYKPVTVIIICSIEEGALRSLEAIVQHVVSSSAQPLVLDKPDKISVCNIECRRVGRVDKQASQVVEPGVGAGAVGGPGGTLHAGDGRDLLGICINNTDDHIIYFCHIQLVAGDIQAGRKVELGVGAEAVSAPRGAAG